MPAVITAHRRFLSVPDAFKSCVSSRIARADGGRELQESLEYFTEKIKEVERKVVDSTDIVDFLVTTNDENLTDNYYAKEKTKRIRTAVVKCNFTDSETLMRSVEDKCKDHKADRVIVSPHTTSVQGVLGEVAEKKGRHTIIIIEQLESMDVDVFNRLISLLSYDLNDEASTMNVSLLICICTSRSAFVAHCQMDNQELLFPKYIELKSPLEQFDEVAAVLVRNPDKKAPKLYLSGDLLTLLKDRFRTDFSLSELKKIVRMSIVHNFLKYDDYISKEDDADDFPERLPVYWVWFDAFYTYLEEAYEEMDTKSRVPNQLTLHVKLQQNPEFFWKDSDPVMNLSTWLGTKNREDLCGTILALASVINDVSPEESAALSGLVASLRAAAAAAAPAAPPAPAAAAAGTPRQTMQQLLAANRTAQAAAAARGNQLRDAVKEVLGMMRAQLFSWAPYDHYLLCVPDDIEIPDLSKSLMSRADKPLSQAYTALAGIDQFKAVPLSRWGEVVRDRMDNAGFYESVAQLQRIGAIKDMSKQGRKAAMLQHRPMTNFN